MISRISDEVGTPAPEALAALGSAWQEQNQQTDEVEELRAENRARNPRVLDMHFVPQMKLADAAAAFPCLDPKYPVAWKQQVRQMRNRLTHLAPPKWRISRLQQALLSTERRFGLRKNSRFLCLFLLK